ncbi:MAG: immunoglobulin domain-containing protein [Verrucomicrobiales bacterium]|nr:immunoglobulin domain-containing protein [Verrucomicrobiales bacterium]
MKNWEGKLVFWFSIFILLAASLLSPQAAFAAATPSITTQPTSQSLLAGTNATFSVVASGQATLLYQWSLNGTNLINSAHLGGATNATLVISNLVAGDAGNYQVVVSNSHGTATSSNATLTVLFPAAITGQPTSQVSQINQTIFLSVAATGTEPLTYHWRKNGTNLLDDGRLNGTTNSTLTISNVQMKDAGGYQLLLNNAYGSVISEEAILQVVPFWSRGMPDLTNAPSNLTNATALTGGYYYNLGLTADGLVTAWGTSNDGATNVPLALSNVVSVAAGLGQALALKSDGSVAVWGNNYFGQTNLPAMSNSGVAVATGEYHNLVLKNDGKALAWGLNSDGQGGVPGGLSNVVAIAAGGRHNLALLNNGTVISWGKNDAGQTNVPHGLSNVVAVSTYGKASLALKSDRTVVAWGDNTFGQLNIPPGLSNVTAIASGLAHCLAIKADGSVVGWGGDAYGETSVPTNLETVVAIAAGYFSTMTMVENPSVKIPPTIWWQNSNSVVPTGQSALFRPYLAGSLPLRFQWYFNGDLLPGETNAWLMLNSVQPGQSGNYQFVVTNNYGSVTGQVALGESPMIVTQPVSQTVFAGSNATFSVAAVGAGSISYQWQVKGYPTTCCWVILGETNSTLAISNVQGSASGNLYRVVVTNAYGSLISATGTLTVLTPPAYTQQPQSQTRALDGSVTFSAVVTGAQPINFQWYGNGSPLTAGGRISIYTGSTSTSLTIAGLQTNDSGNYFLVSSNLVGVTNSSVADLTVVVPPSIIQNPASQTTIVGSNATFNVVAGGGEPLAYQWRVNGANLADGGQVSGARSNSLTLSNMTTPGTNSYNVVVTNFAGSVTSATASLTIYGVQITGQPAGRMIQLGSNTTFTVSAIGQTPFTYQWYFNGTPLADDSYINGSATGTLSLTNAQVNHGGTYSVAVSNEWSTATSTNATLKLRPNIAGAVLYVSRTSTTPQSPYLDWSSAATNIHDATEVAIDGNLILVTNGIYGSGGTYVAEANTRAGLIKAVTLRSVNGSEATAIVGGGQRGVFVGSNAVLSGFTVSNGFAAAGGGGIWCEPAGVVTNCLVQGNSAGFNKAGGGIYGGTVFNSVIMENTGISGAGAYRSRLFNCIISSNSTIAGGYGYGAGAYQCILSNCLVIGNNAVYSASGGGTANGTNYYCTISGNTAAGGGGSYSSTNFNCILLGNTSRSIGGGSRDGGNFNCLIASNSSASYGGGVYGGAHYNCTIVNNSVNSINYSGGGAYSCALYNSIIYFNSAVSGSNWSSAALIFCCTVPGGSVTNDPSFSNLAGGDFHLQTGSPCINAGNNGNVRGTNDLDGNPRLVGYAVDIGAYEQSPAAMLPNSWLLQYGFPNNGSADYLDSDGDGLNNWQEWKASTVPTNAASVLALSSPSNSVSGITVTWQSVSGVTYYLQSSTNLLAFTSIQSNIVGQAVSTSYTDTTATNAGPYYYRVGVQ